MLFHFWKKRSDVLKEKNCKNKTQKKKRSFNIVVIVCNFTFLVLEWDRKMKRINRIFYIIYSCESGILPKNEMCFVIFLRTKTAFKAAFFLVCLYLSYKPLLCSGQCQMILAHQQIVFPYIGPLVHWAS